MYGLNEHLLSGMSHLFQSQLRINRNPKIRPTKLTGCTYSQRDHDFSWFNRASFDFPSCNTYTSRVGIRGRRHTCFGFVSLHHTPKCHGSNGSVPYIPPQHIETRPRECVCPHNIVAIIILYKFILLLFGPLTKISLLFIFGDFTFRLGQRETKQKKTEKRAQNKTTAAVAGTLLRRTVIIADIALSVRIRPNAYKSECKSTHKSNQSGPQTTHALAALRSARSRRQHI